MRVSQMKHLGHNEFPFEDVSASGMLAALLAGRLILLTHLAQDRKRNFMGRASA